LTSSSGNKGVHLSSEPTLFGALESGDVGIGHDADNSYWNTVVSQPRARRMKIRVVLPFKINVAYMTENELQEPEYRVNRFAGEDDIA